ncbi:2867_t:CDS:2 [Funneliformis geosporum]|nr:2867_t:CDS:2 [Funneliformis geosporum]
MADNKFLPRLSQNLLECLEDNEYYDVTIEVGKDPYVKIFRAHMIILYYRSPYLQRALSANKKRNDGTLVHIKLPNILPECFHEILSDGTSPTFDDTSGTVHTNGDLWISNIAKFGVTLIKLFVPHHKR